MKLSDIHIRDPFVLPQPSEKIYYLYGTMGAYTWTKIGVGFDCYTSTDLQTWEGPFPVFRPPSNFWADYNFWAPEVHVYQGRYFMFASFKADGICRGTQILVAESPLGPFLPLSAGPVTPPDWECLDGTLFVTPEGNPWIVFSHEWVQVGDGEICALPLSKDLTSAIGEPVLLFHASKAPWIRQHDSKGRKGYITDGPWMHSLPGGELLILWSSFSAGGYSIGVARSASAELLGPWQHDAQPLYSSDGGHCMTFRDFNGNTWLSFHHPDGFPGERPKFLPLAEDKLA
ncbi:MAG: glycoside hydrolase [Chloroflexi bacterium HGW-Chloroflexi-10]|nr:MAG: glycoside hydrolase [Chloroflexi bacterium HGW-Chloroflexi-10]